MRTVMKGGDTLGFIRELLRNDSDYTLFNFLTSRKERYYENSNDKINRPRTLRSSGFGKPDEHICSIR